MAAPARLDLDLPDLAATRALGARLARLLRPGDLATLSGELGVGKTELVRAVVHSLAGAAVEVPSPSFTLVQRYQLPGLVLTHADLFRLEGADELAELGLDEALAEGCLVVEWPERAEGLLPEDRLAITLAFAKAPDARRARIEAGPGFRARLAGLAP